MALRLSRDLKAQQSQESKGIDITGTQGTNYNLDEIKENKSRTSNTAIKAQTAESTFKTSEGNISVKPSTDKIIANNADAAKYLFQNEPSTDAYTPAVTLRRPIVIWEEGTPDTSVPDYSDNVYNSIYALEDRVKELEEQLKNK